MFENRVPRQTWFGYSKTRSRLFVGVALSVFLGMFALHTPSIAEVVSSYGIPTGFGVNFGVLLALVVLSVAANAYANGGVLVSFLLAAAPVFGTIVPSVLFSQSPFFARFISALPFWLAVVLLGGTVGFVLGSGVRRLRKQL